ncbi:MAG: hypothetical protein U0931_27375 [Vulcanimicrobiota bacterium]
MKRIIAFSLGGLFFCGCSSSDPWNSAKKGQAWVRGEPVTLNIGGEPVAHRRYIHPLGVKVEVREEYPVTIESNRLLIHGPACNFEQVISALASQQEAYEEGVRWVEKTRQETDPQRLAQFGPALDKVKNLMTANSSQSKFDATIPDPDAGHHYQENLWIAGDGKKAYFTVDRSCIKSGDPHHCSPARPELST